MTGPGGPTATPSGKEGSWDGGIRVFGNVLLYGALAVLVLFFYRGDLSLGTTLLYLVAAAAVGAVVGRLIAGWKYGMLVVVGILFAGIVLLGVLMDPPPLGVFVVGYLLGLRFAPVDVATRDARRAR